MKLTYWELDYVHGRMDNYNIKFQEIYNELFDHIVTAIEERSAAGDSESLERMYEEVVNTQFRGFYGVANEIEELAKSHENAYKSKVKKMIWANYRHHLNLKTLLFTVVLMLLSFELPHNKLTSLVLTISILAAALFSIVYAYIGLRGIRPSRGKKSLVYAYTLVLANFPLVLLNAVLWLPQLPYEFMGKDPGFKIANIPLPVLALVLALILVYNLSCVRLCRHEVKQFMNTL
jgi:hypothetical protein